MRKRSDGFTLVELMVVVLVIGILVAIAVPVFKSAKDDAAARACQANQRAWAGAVEACIAAGERPIVPGSAGEGAQLMNSTHYWYAPIIGKYIKAVPICPSPKPGATGLPGMWQLPSQRWFDGLYYSCGSTADGRGSSPSSHRLFPTVEGSW